jgi:cyclic pyranopterin phosphate synthase
MTFTHLDEHGKARMVDVNAKAITVRTATATCKVKGLPAEMLTIDLRNAARVAGMQAALQTPYLVPLCHPIPIDAVMVDVQDEDAYCEVSATVTTAWKTGVEMEALTAVSVAALTLVAIDPSKACVEDIAVRSKTGGKSGAWGSAIIPC